MAVVLIHTINIKNKEYPDNFDLKEIYSMETRISFVAFGIATSFLLTTSFVICVIFDLIFPSLAMYTVWQNLLPGFTWISWGSFVLGVIETIAYAWFITVLWVPVYNQLNRKTTKPT